MAMRRREPGFTLVETLVALAILSGVLVATYAALSDALSVVVRLRQRADVVRLVEQQVAVLRTQLPVPAQPDLHGQTVAYGWRIAVVPLPRPAVARNAPLALYRVTGLIIRRAGPPRPETVVDTVLLGRSP